MQSIRDLKRKARRDIHHRMNIPAVYIRTPSAVPVLVHVRLHNHWDRTGDIKGSRTYPAEIENLAPKVIFDLCEIASTLLVQNAVVSFQTGEAYSLDHVLPPDDLFQHACIIPLLADKAAGLPVPSEDGCSIVLSGNAG